MEKKKTILIAAIVAAVLLIGGGGFFIYQGMQPDPEDAWSDYVALLSDKKYEELYAKLDEASQKKINKEDFVTRNKNIYEGMDATSISSTIKDVKDASEGKTISYAMDMSTAAGKLSFDNTVTVHKEDGEYKISWDSTQIFPDLNDDNKVSVQVTNAMRGSILDRNGTALATQGSVFKAGLVAGSMSDETASIKALAAALDMSEDSVKNALSASWVQKDMFVPVKTLSQEDKDKVSEALNKIDGVQIQTASGRVYPYGEMAAHLTGYVQTVTAEDLEKHPDEGYSTTSLIGKTGLESIYEKQLRGTDGCVIQILNADGTLKKTMLEQQQKDGEDIKTTIDINVQKTLYEQIKKDAGSGTAMNSKTGEVLGLVSMPAYDPNDFANGMDSATWKSLSENKQTPLLNRFTSTYSPGSTFKAITGAIGLDSKTITADTTFEKTDKWQKDSSWGSNYVTTTKSYSEPSNLKNAYVYSDNIFFAQLGDKIGAKTFTSYLDKLYFNKQLDFPFAITKSTYGDNMNKDQTLAASAYGQGDLLLSPIHLTSLYTAYVNEGSVAQPYLIYENGASKTLVKNAYSKETAKEIMSDLQAAMAGYGDNPTNAGGKTGTAQVNNGDQEIGWMCAVNDHIAVTVMIDDTKEIGQSHYVIPKVQSILSDLK